MNVGEKLNEGEIRELFRNADIDSDGSIDLHEFLAMITNNGNKMNPELASKEIENMKKKATSEETQLGANKVSEATFIGSIETRTDLWRNTVRDFRKQGNILLETDL